MSVATFEQMRLFAIEQLWPLREPITEHTALAHDFCIAGHDGKEFMEAYAFKFGVNLGAFDWPEYFGAEGGANPFGLVAYLYKRFVRGIPARELEEVPELTLGHLVMCANIGKWKAPERRITNRSH
jgi:hypothetical protein